MRAPGRLGWLLLSLPLAASGCFDAPVSGPDASLADLPSTDRSSPLDAPDAPDPSDAPGVPDVTDVLDVPAALDVPDVSADLGPRCTSSSDCSDGRLCGLDGRCAPCAPSDDRCPAAQHCDPTLLGCVPGCRSDEGCTATPRADGGVAPARCDLARHACLDCDVDDDCPARSVCRMGQCTAGCNERRGCAPGEVCCTGSCVDVQADIGNCGACGRRCAVSNGVPACTAGACGIEACTVGFADCNRSLADGCEANLQGDPARCGACDVSCPTPPGAGSAACGAGRCGYLCAAGMADCDGDARTGCERSVATDPGNCGRCGNACPARTGASVPRCETGRCGYTCDLGRGDCDGDAANGCETDVGTSLANCGLCGSACAVPANASATCAAGRCGYACNAGYGDCDRDPANGCEVDLRTSVASCGRCGAACTVSGGTPACVDGACTVATCGGSFANCDGLASNGCETDTRSTAAHCGMCGRACPVAPHATALCVASACTTRCAPSYGDCDGNAANGCETDLRTAVAHCGRCDVACVTANGTPGCSAGACVVAGCSTGKGNCDGLAANGCETDLATSPNHCGACGVVGAEVCDGRDNSCDGVADNGCPRSIGGLAGFDFTSPEYGTGTGTSTSATCAAGQVVRGIFGRVNGSLVTQLNVICGTAQITEDRATTPFRYAATLTGATDVGAVGTAVGTAFRYQCPGDSVVTRIRGRASPYLYQFMVDCSTLAVTGNPGSLRVTATPLATSPGFGSATGGTFDYPCPANASGSASVLRGLFGRPFRLLTSIYSTSVGARCSVPSITLR